MASNNPLNEIREMNIQKPDYMLGKGLQMPFAASNSGSRKIMFGTQLEHRLPLTKPEVPFIQTGYEMEFGVESSSYVVTNESLKVVGIIPKYSWMPKHQYYIIAVGEDSHSITVIERKEYKHITENYGYLYNNNLLDGLEVGRFITKGAAIQKSAAFDDNDNRMDGCNMLTMYSACEDTMEDAIVISETASKKLTSPLVKKVTIIINDNNIPLNLYGDEHIYKVFPDIGEESVHGILCGLRLEKKEECLYSQSYSRLRELSISDEKYTVAGRVVDINVYCNAPAALGENAYNAQIKRYYDENIRMCREIVSIIDKLKEEGYALSYEASKLYSDSKGCINGKQYFSERVFSNIILEITLVEEIPVLRGDKLSNRYGGKGITSKIKPDSMMPRTKNGEIVDVILNMCGVYGRENAGQLFEITVTYICKRIIEYIQLNVLDAGECVKMYLDLLSVVAPSMKDDTEKMLSTLTDEECVDFIAGACSSEKCMYLVIEPMSENMTIDKVAKLYDMFPWIKPETMYMPVVDSVGEIAYVPSRRPLIYGYQYIYRLKQYAEEKFSVTSMSATNIRNENSKSKSSNNYKALYSRTPIRFGNMETGNLIHLGSELVVQMLMLYSTSPHGRRLVKEMLTGDPFNVNVKLDDDSINRNAEILNVYLKTMGLRLTFERRRRIKEHPILVSPIFFDDNRANPLIDPFIWCHPNEKTDLEAEVRRLVENKSAKWPIMISPIEFFEPEEYRDDQGNAKAK